MSVMGTVKGNVVVLDDEVTLPEGARVEINIAGPHEVSLPDHAIDPLDVEARVRAARARLAHLSPEERAARVRALAGSLAHLPGSVDDFLREKHEETERQEQRFERRWRTDPE